MSDPEHPSLAEVIADGVPVDWAREASSGRFSLEEIQRFQSVERIVEAHRRLIDKAADSITWGLEENETKTTPLLAGDVSRPQETWGHLQLRDRVGRGGFGDVYRAFDPMLERDVALKLLKDKGHPQEDTLRRFQAEARRLARVRHDNVVIVHGADVRDERMGIWTDFLHGNTLEELLTMQGPMNAREASLVGMDLCRALAAVHGAGLVHRDVKTSNVMRTDGGRIVLFDFGLAAAEQRFAPDAVLTSVGGTPLYMAPEVLDGSPPDRSGDLYALGVLLYRLVSGRYPIEAAMLVDIKDAHRNGRRNPLRSVAPDLPAEFVRIVEKAIAPLPADRYPDAASLEKDLGVFVGTGTTLPKPWYLRPVSLIAGGTLAAALVTGLLVMSMVAPTFSIGASMYKDGDTQVLTGDKVQPGERITLKLHPSRAARVIVLNRDPQGRLQRLFPESGTAGALLAADRDQQIPPDTPQEERYWKIGASGGRESFVILAAGASRWWPWKAPTLPKDLALELSMLPAAQENETFANALPDSSAATERSRATPESRMRTQGSEGPLEWLVQQAEAAHKVHVQRFDLHIEGN